MFLDKGKKRGIVNVPYRYLNEEGTPRATQWLKHHVAESETGAPVELSDSNLSKFLSDKLVKNDDGNLCPSTSPPSKTPSSTLSIFRLAGVALAEGSLQF